MKGSKGSQQRESRSPYRRKLVLSALSFTLLVVMLPAMETGFSDTVGRIVDGDTLELVGGEEVRLHGIDAPEAAQPYGEAATRFLRELTLGRVVTVRVTDRDRYGRLVGWIVLENGSTAQELLIEAGLAWWYREYAPDARRLRAAEEDARVASRGLWEQDDPTPPWEWRRSRREAGLPPGVADRDCSDFSTRQEAQRFFEAAGGPEVDPHRLDGDGVVCLLSTTVVTNPT